MFIYIIFLYLFNVSVPVLGWHLCFVNQVKPANPWILLHISILLFGFTGILGKLISIPALPLVWWRVILVGCVMMFWMPAPWKSKGRSDWKKILPSGIAIVTHWVAFYASIHWSNASVAVIMLATGSLFTSIFEHFLLRKQIHPIQWVIGILIIPGMCLIGGGIPERMWLGMGAGVIAAILMGLFAVMNKKLLDTYSPKTIMYYQMWTGCILLIPVLLFQQWIEPGTPFLPQGMDWVWMIILAIVCTIFAYEISLRAQESISAFTVNLTFNLEPVYTILLAIWIFQEQAELGFWFWVGVVWIIGIVGANIWFESKRSKAIIEQ